MALGLSHSGPNVYSSSAPARELLVGTLDGVVIFEREGLGAPWREARRALPGRHISSIVVEPDSGTVFAGAFHGGLHASTDGGRTWERREAGLGFEDVFSMSARRFDGRTRLFAGTEPAHLFYSDDLGGHWTELPTMRSVPTVDKWWFPAPPHVAHTKFIAFDPYDPHVIYSCIEQGALLKSEDDGQTWRELNTLGFYNDKTRSTDVFYDVHKALIDPRDPRRMFVSGGGGLYVTPDGGGHWERRMIPVWASDVYPDAIVMRPSQPDVMVMASAEHNPATWRESHYAGGMVWRSTDAGVNWERLEDGLPDRTRHEFGALTLDDWGESFSLYAATTGGEVYASDDGGDHWSLLVSGLGAISKRGHDQLVVAAAS
jgi:photosystem II stability/assembly factor-like uncharacterized protein